MHTPDRLRKTLDVVEIVLGFLSSGGGKAGRSLWGYINHTLKMKKRPFSEKVQGHYNNYIYELDTETKRFINLRVLLCSIASILKIYSAVLRHVRLIVYGSHGDVEL